MRTTTPVACRRRPSPIVLPLLRYATAGVWLVFGLGFKVLGLVPRHERIVAAVLAAAYAGPGKIAVEGGETLLA